MNLSVTNPRACDECKACCTTCAVNELDKPLNTPCVHLAVRGCGIYATRPHSCREWNCAWLLGHLKDEDRPDRCGTVWSFEEVEGVEGLLAHAMLLNDQLPMELLERQYNELRRSSHYPLTLQIIPHDFHPRAHAKIHGRQVRPGVFVAVEEA